MDIIVHVLHCGANSLSFFLSLPPPPFSTMGTLKADGSGALVKGAINMVDMHYNLGLGRFCVVCIRKGLGNKEQKEERMWTWGSAHRSIGAFGN